MVDSSLANFARKEKEAEVVICHACSVVLIPKKEYLNNVSLVFKTQLMVKILDISYKGLNRGTTILHEYLNWSRNENIQAPPNLQDISVTLAF